MALIKCPDCGNTVSDKTVTCLKCGRPIAPPAVLAGAPAGSGAVQTIEKTSKKLKGWLATWFGGFMLSILVMMIAGGAESSILAVIGTLMFLVSAGGMAFVKYKIWWEHE